MIPSHLPPSESILLLAQLVAKLEDQHQKHLAALQDPTQTRSHLSPAEAKQAAQRLSRGLLDQVARIRLLAESFVECDRALQAMDKAVRQAEEI